MGYELMPAPKEWYDIDGGHFGLLYHPSPLFDEATRIQTEFLKRRLSRRTRQEHSSARVGLPPG